MSALASALDWARQSTDPHEYISGVKRAIQDNLTLLDPSVKIEDTQYFNHSAVPDFVLSWSGEKSSRNVYLRDSYASVVAADETRVLNDQAPVILSLSSETDFPQERTPVGIASIQAQVQKAPRTLLTDPMAMDTLTVRSPSESPVPDLIRANFARGARGLVDSHRAHQLVGSDGLPMIDLRRSQTRGLEANFTEAIARQISRTAQLIAIGTDVIDLEGALGAQDDDPTLYPSEKLTGTELRLVLPWLLRNPRVTDSPLFWGYVGTMMDLKELEALRDVLSGLNLSPLVAANLHRWTGTRAYLGVSTLANDPDDTNSQIHQDGVWAFIGNVLGANYLGERLFLSSDGKLLREGRSHVSAALWDELKRVLQGFKLASVRLNGLSRSITVDAEQSLDIRRDVDEITRSVEDTYYVSEVGFNFRDPVQDGSVFASVKLGANLVVASRPVALADLVSSALQVLNYRNPASHNFILDVSGRRNLPPSELT